MCYRKIGFVLMIRLNYLKIHKIQDHCKSKSFFVSSEYKIGTNFLMNNKIVFPTTMIYYSINYNIFTERSNKLVKLIKI